MMEPAASPMNEHASRWRGTSRYDVIRSIGEGGMGTVYEAFDRERRQLVAIKTLIHADAAALYLFKQEFRTLVDVQHPNLVHLYEFIAIETEQPFFAMELVRGHDFLTHVQRADREREPLVELETVKPELVSGRRLRSDGPSAPPKRASTADLENLRSALRQLVEGIQALHAAGKLHRDLKPSNVLVTLEGRVVILDFGVAIELTPSVDGTQEPEIVGTARYMAPEQAASEPPTSASDWYSVGVMLYEALTGRPPFTGSLMDIIAMKSELDPPTPGTLVSGVPEDLDRLCMDLLARDPKSRPGGSQILRRLDGGRTSVRPRVAPPQYSDPSGLDVLVGRNEQMRAFRDAFSAVQQGRSVTLRVRGASGMGKSALVQRCVDDLVNSGQALALRGRTYERESVPFKAFDSLVDALSRLLMRQADEEHPITLPRDLAALARVFPVLRRVQSVRELEDPVIHDPVAVRRRAFVALREVIAALCRRRPLVVHIDDIHWGDVDSAALLFELVRPPSAPPMLLVLSYREEESRSSPFISELHRSWPDGAEMRDIAVGPLGFDEACRLARTLLPSTDGAADARAATIALESSGSPFLLHELTRSWRPRGEGRPVDAPAAATIELMVEERLAHLPAATRKLLEIVAVSGRPLPVAIASEAAAIYEKQDETVGLLRARRLVRTGLRDGREIVEMSHDRFRETIVARLPPDGLRAHHERLARVLESTPGADMESLAAHLFGAGDNQRAARYAERAAEAAVTKLAFVEAVRLYRLALDSTSAGSDETRRLRMALAQVLEWAGRGAEAAQEYLLCADGASAIQRVELERLAAEQLLSSGRIDEGVAALHRVLASVGMNAPRTFLSAIVTLLVFRLWLRIVGLRFRERDREEVRLQDRVRIDALQTVAMGLGFVDAGFGAAMQARHMTLALRTGDRTQVLRAAGMEVVNFASTGGAVGRREQELSDLVQRLSEKTGEGEWKAFFHGTRGIRLFLHGRWKEAHAVLDGAYASYPRHRAGWHANGELFGVWSLVYLGKLGELARRHARLVADAQERGNLYTSVSLRLSNLAWLVVDDVATARRQVREALADWSHTGFYLQHFRAMGAEANSDLYAGDGAAAYERVAHDWPALKKTFLLRVQYVRADAFFTRARSAVASAAACARPQARLAEADRLATRLERERMPWTATLAALARAAVANARHRGTDTRGHLRAAIEHADATDMALHAAVARRQLGVLEGGETGRALVRQAESWMRSEGVVAPDGLARMLLPGVWAGPDG